MNTTRTRIEESLNKWKSLNPFHGEFEDRENLAVIRKRYNRARRARERRETDISFRIEGACRSRLKYALRQAKTKTRYHTIDLIGISATGLCLYLESLFKAGMTWENYGEWEIDHIRPCASFDLTLESDVKACFHYTNLQPLWKEENRAKRDKWIP